MSLLGNREHTYYLDPLHSRGSLKLAIKYSTQPRLDQRNRVLVAATHKGVIETWGITVLGFPFFSFPSFLFPFFSIYSKHRHDPDVITKVPLRRICLFDIIRI